MQETTYDFRTLTGRIVPDSATVKPTVGSTISAKGKVYRVREVYWHDQTSAAVVLTE